MRYALIFITVALMISVGFSWVPADTIPNTQQPDAVDDSAPEPVYYDTVPVEYIDFEPLHVNVYYVSRDPLDEEKHSELY